MHNNRIPDTIQIIFNEEKNYIIISNPKIATTFISNYIDDKFINVEINNDGNLELPNNNNTNLSICWESLDTDKSRPEIIILYREPYDRFLTGVIQDCIFERFSLNSVNDSYNNLSNPFLHYFFKNKGYDTSTYLDFLNKISSYINNLKFSQMYIDYFEAYLNCIIDNNRVMAGHNRSYLTIISKLLLLGKLKSTDMFINISNKNEPIERKLKLKKIYPAVTYDRSYKSDLIHSHAEFKHILNQVINSNDYFKDSIMNILSTEMTTYNILKNNNLL
jgi:hypothetical protein